jgi:hypothetical protein
MIHEWTADVLSKKDEFRTILPAHSERQPLNLGAM